MAVDEHTVEIRYGSSFGATDDYFSFSGMPTPYLSRSQEMVYQGGKWCQLTTLTLDGQIIGSVPVEGENLNTISLLHDREKILRGFSESFQRLAIYENNTPRKTFFGCMVRDVDFSPANYGIQDYSITLDCIEEDQFTLASTFGVLEPVETVNFNDNEDGTVSISHQVSAQGFTTNTLSDSEMAITKAKNFVESRTGYNVNKVIPQFMGGLSDSNLIITNINKDINRVDGTYSCSVEYLVQTGNIGEIPLSAGFVNIIDTSVTSGVNSDYLEVGVNYRVQGDKYASAADIRNNQPSTGNLFKAATGAAGIEQLNSVPLTISVTDNSQTEKSIQVSASYDGNTIFQELETGVFFDYNVDVSTDDVTDTATVSINGEIRARGNNRAQFLEKSGHYFQEVSGSLFNLANEIYSAVNYNKLYNNVGWPLNPSPVNDSVDFDEIAGTVKCSASYNNNDFKTDYKKFTYKVDVTPALNQYTAKPSCNENGLYTIYDINSNTRERISLSIDSVADSIAQNAKTSYDFLQEMHNYSNNLSASYVPLNDTVIESESSSSPKVNQHNQTDFASNINQVYTLVNTTSFYS